MVDKLKIETTELKEQIKNLLKELELEKTLRRQTEILNLIDGSKVQLD
jgi:hypothetical protein